MALKITKTSVHRFGIERECGCKAVREFEDARYQKSLNDGQTFLCEKHESKSPDAQEMAREFLIDTLSMRAEMEGKQYAPMHRDVEPGDSAGVVAVGESVQAMGATNLPKRNPDTLRTRPKRDPLSVTHVSVDRTDQRLPQRTAADTVTADVDAGDGISITGDIETVPEDPNLSGAVVDGLGDIEDALDEADMKDAGVPRSALNQARD